MHLTELERTVRTMPAVLREQAGHHKDDVFLMHEQTVFTFGDADTLTDSYAGGFQHIGVRKSTHVALLMDSSPEYVWTWLALGRLGAVAVPLNTAYKGVSLLHALRQANVSVLVVDAKYLDLLAPIEAKLSELRTLVTKGVDQDENESFGRTRVAFEDLPRPWDRSVPFPDVAGRDLATILFTSGTTGPSKGVMLAHSAWCDAAMSTLDLRDVRDTDVFYTVSPMFHSAAWSPSINCALATALPVGLDKHFSVSEFWNRVRHYGATQLFSIAPMHDWIFEAAPSSSDRDNPARVWGPLPMAPDRVEPFKARFGLEHLWFSYGQTEASMLTCTDVNKPHKPGSSGWSRPEVELAVVDDLDNILPRGEIGELVVRPIQPHTIMDGYWGMPEANERAFRNLWYHTGDFCRIDADGEVFFIDRKADYVRIRGENVSSFEVEEAAASHPDVLEAAAFAVLEPGSSVEELMLAVVTRTAAVIAPREIYEHCAAILPRFAIPRFVRVVQSFPRTPTNKVQKYELRDRGIEDGTWDSSSLKVIQRDEI